VLALRATRQSLSATTTRSAAPTTFRAGSPEYVACRKDRDVQRSNAAARADQKQRSLGEYMLNNPVRP